jgi:UDPglucose--hexose-1-phosphate uridylyltransferase
MPQLRQDPTTKEWIIIAAERSKRPNDFRKIEPAIEKPAYKEDCPFCPGNEHLTPHETLAYRKGGPPDSKGWWVRVIPNKFPALSPEGSLERKEEKGGNLTYLSGAIPCFKGGFEDQIDHHL